MARQMKDSGIEWIGEIPTPWNTDRLQWHLEEVNVSNSPVQSENILSLTIEAGIIPYEEKGNQGNKSKENYEEYKLAYPDTLVVNSMNVIIGAVGISKYFGCVSPVYYVFKAAEETDLRYIYYLFTNVGFQKEMRKHAKGILEIRLRISSGDMLKLSIPNPAYEEQHRIAAFLDRKCAEIDAVIERTKATIEEYKRLKQAVITEAVTKGVRGPRPMKDSGIEWIGEIPEEWEVNRIKYVSNFEPGCSKDGLTDRSIITYTPMDCIKNGWFINNTATLGSVSSSLTAYQEGDIVMAKVTPCFENGNIAIMCGLASGFGLGSSELFVIRPTKIETKYMFYWLRNTVFMQRACATMTGTGGLKRVSPSFMRDCFIHIPPSAEQAEIAAYLDDKCAALDTLIAKKTALLTELETYKKSLIYEYVTGKKECPEAVEQAAAAVEYPFFPAAVSTKRLRFAQAMMMAKVLDMHGKGMGRVKLEKMLYTIETSIGFDFDTEYVREAAGPLHASIYKCEGIISRQNHWYQLHQSQYGVSYTPTKDAGKYRAYYDKYFSSYNAEIERIIDIFKPYSTDQAEIVATLFAAWNDAIIDRKSYTDEDIVDDVLNNWHDNKKRFPKDVWLRAMEQMRKNNLIPKGYGKHTVMKAAEM